MIKQCSGESNQLFDYDGSDAKYARYVSKSLTNFCLTASSPGLSDSMEQLRFRNTTDALLSVSICKSGNADLWHQTEIRGMAMGTFRFASVSSKLCISPHIPWNVPCNGPQCESPSGNSIRQAVLKDCDANSHRNTFRFSRSKHFAQRVSMLENP